MGDDSEMGPYLKMKQVLDDKVLSPYVVLTKKKQFKRFNKPHIYDMFLYCTQNSRFVSDLYDIASSFKTSDKLDRKAWGAEFQQSPQFHELSEFTKAMNGPEGSVILMVNDAQEYLILNLPDFSTMEIEYAHVHAAYESTPEFLLTPHGAGGISLEDLVAKHDGPFGPKTLRVLHRMGYRVRDLSC
jgi:hypothetical protein